MDADTIIANLIEKHTPKKDSSHIIKFSSNNKKLIGAVILAIFLIYFMFFTGSKSKTDKDTAKTKKIKKK
jgi:hypothetical protein